MKKILKMLGLPKEAILLDSGLYLVKAFLALVVTYGVASLNLGLRVDMVSILLGVMYTLEPTNRAGIRGGLNQLLTSSLGAITTGILVLLVGYQISAWVVALGVVLTVYISLKQDYRFVSPAALFTSIYMTQLIQTNAQGLPSVWMTFVVRISSLGFGILMALLFNYLFSFIYYRNLGQKRLEFVKTMAVNGLKRSLSVLQKPETSSDKLSLLGGVFSDIEMVKANLETLLQEKHLNLKHKAKLIQLNTQVNALKNIIHLAYDSLFLVQEKTLLLDPSQLDFFEELIHKLDALDFLKDELNPKPWIHTINHLSNRHSENLIQMKEQFDALIHA